jgi:RHS repeat-associated protein
MRCARQVIARSFFVVRSLWHWCVDLSLKMRLAAVCFAGTTVALLLIVSPVDVSAQSGSASPSAHNGPEPRIVRELPPLRTASSDTYERSDGTRVMKSYATPINYRNSAGEWAPIENQLVKSEGGGWHPKASGVPVALPDSLSSGPVSFGASGKQVTLSLRGAASSTATSSANEGRYASALPGVDVAYRVGSTGLRETLTLASASAPTVYRYALGLDAGMKAIAERWGGVEIDDAAGHPLYRIATPVAEDAESHIPAHGAVHYELSADGKTLSLVVDSTWLHAANRAFPVKIDPDIEYFNDELDCDIISGVDAGTSYCGQPLVVGSDSEPFTHARALMRFSLSGIPQNSTVLGTEVSMFFGYQQGTVPQTMQAYVLKQKFTANATWEDYDGTHEWTTQGGSYESLSLPGGGTQPFGEHTYGASELGDWEDWPPIGITPLVQKWVSEPSSNDGLLLKDAHEAASEAELTEYDWFEQKEGPNGGGPVLQVIYAHPTGSQADHTYTGFPVDDRANLSVDVASGNVMTTDTGFTLPGIGSNFPIEATFNDDTGDAVKAGIGWSLSSDTYTYGRPYWWDETIDLHEASGRWLTFTREPSLDKEGTKAYLSPAGINATMTMSSGYQMELTYTLSRVKFVFKKESGVLEKIVDPNGNTIKFEYEGGEERVSKVTDSHGHVFKYTYEGHEGDLSKIEDPSGRKWLFAENSSNELTSLTDPDGHAIKYEYSTAENLKQITDPDGHLIELTYDEDGRVTRIRRIVNGTATTTGNKDIITTFAYSEPASTEAKCPEGTLGDTVVVSPNGSPNGEANSKASEHKTTYCFNAADEITKTVDQAGNATTASYDSAFGTLTKYQNPGDTAKEGKVNSTVAYAENGAVEKVIEGTAENHSLETIYNYTGGFGGVEPGSVQTPRSKASQKSSEHTTTYGYDTHGNVTSSSQGGSETKTTYNSLGQPEKSIDGDGHEIKYEYGATSHDLTKITPPSPLGVTEITYDSLDRVHTVKDGRGNAATYKYDGEDRVTEVEYSDGSNVKFEYDANGNVLKRTDASGFGEPYTGLTSYEYDHLNRPTLETTPTAKTITYGYDYDGNLTSLKDAGGTVSYSYGSDDLLTSMTDPSNSTHPYKFGYASEDDERQSIKYPNGMWACYTHDAAGRLTGLRVFVASGSENCSSSIATSAELEDYGLNYNLEYEEEGKKEVVDTPQLQVLTNNKTGTRTVYSYDLLDRLTKALSEPVGGGAGSLTSEYEYDKAGNMLLNHTYSSGTTYANEHMKYNGANEICAIATTTPSTCPAPSEPGITGEPTYDADGEMTSDGVLSGADKFAYTIRDQLSSITPYGASAKTIVSHGTGQEDLAAIGSEEVVTNALGVGATGSGESAKYYTRGSEGLLLDKRSAKGTPSETEYYALDPFESVAALTSAGGSQTAPASGTYQYDAYGSPLGASPATFSYNSGQALPAGLIHYGSRYYAPGMGSWTQEDPLGEDFLYAGDDPINETDPSGLLRWHWHLWGFSVALSKNDMTHLSDALTAVGIALAKKLAWQAAAALGVGALTASQLAQHDLCFTFWADYMGGHHGQATEGPISAGVYKCYE